MTTTKWFQRNLFDSNDSFYINIRVHITAIANAVEPNYLRPYWRTREIRIDAVDEYLYGHQSIQPTEHGSHNVRAWFTSLQLFFFFLRIIEWKLIQNAERETVLRIDEIRKQWKRNWWSVFSINLHYYISCTVCVCLSMWCTNEFIRHLYTQKMSKCASWSRRTHIQHFKLCSCAYVMFSCFRFQAINVGLTWKRERIYSVINCTTSHERERERDLRKMMCQFCCRFGPFNTCYWEQNEFFWNRFAGALSLKIVLDTLDSHCRIYLRIRCEETERAQSVHYKIVLILLYSWFSK